MYPETLTPTLTPGGSARSRVATPARLPSELATRSVRSMRMPCWRSSARTCPQGSNLAHMGGARLVTVPVPTLHKEQSRAACRQELC